MQSIYGQQGKYDYDWLYIDDASGYTLEQKNFLSHLTQSRILFLERRHYQIGAIAKGISLIKDPNTIVCLVDGDDYLLGDALLYVGKAYQNSQIAMSYGNTLIDFRPYQDPQSNYFFDKKMVNTEYAEAVWKQGSFRADGFRCFHLRTFKRWLWDLIDSKDFLRQNGTSLQASGDSSFVFPMLELLGNKEHVAFIETPIYVYRLHSDNVHNQDKKSQTDDLEYLRFKKQPYPKIKPKLLTKYLGRH